jgi:hypothetical protein
MRLPKLLSNWPRVVAILICLGLLAFGLIRIGVGGALIGQELGWWSQGGEMAEALAETRHFLAEKSPQALIPMSPAAYFGVIIFMGVSLSLGAGLCLMNRRGGLSLIALYLATHGWLFVNFQTINPKIAVLGLGIAMWLVLLWVRRRE